jgi:hypothetical protein
MHKVRRLNLSIVSEADDALSAGMMDTSKCCPGAYVCDAAKLRLEWDGWARGMRMPPSRSSWCLFAAGVQDSIAPERTGEGRTADGPTIMIRLLAAAYHPMDLSLW